MSLYYSKAVRGGQQKNHGGEEELPIGALILREVHSSLQDIKNMRMLEIKDRIDGRQLQERIRRGSYLGGGKGGGRIRRLVQIYIIHLQLIMAL